MKKKMKTSLRFATLLVVTLGFLFASSDATAQCGRCSFETDWKKTRGASKALKAQFPTVGKVKWYECWEGYVFAVEDFGDSSYTYIFSEEHEWLAKETRYFVTVPFYPDCVVEAKEMVKNPSPEVLPKAIWSLAAKSFYIDDLSVLTTECGMKYSVCDLYKLELSPTHLLSKAEGNTTFYVTSFDYIFVIYNQTKEVLTEVSGTTDGAMLYSEPENVVWE